MKTTIKHLSDTRVELTITLTGDELSLAEQVALSKLARDVKVPGFRKGKVPIAVAQKNVDPQKLQEQTLDDAISKSVATAFTEEKIQVLDRPSVEVKKFVPRETLEFTAEAEVLPAITLGNYKKLKATVEKVTVTAKEVDEIIERMCAGLGEKKDVKRAAKTGDAFTLTTQNDNAMVRAIENTLGMKLERRRLEGFDYTSPPARSTSAVPLQQSQRHHRQTGVKRAGSQMSSDSKPRYNRTSAKPFGKRRSSHAAYSSGSSARKPHSSHN